MFLMLCIFNIKRTFQCTNLLIVNSVKVKSVTGYEQSSVADAELI